MQAGLQGLENTAQTIAEFNLEPEAQESVSLSADGPKGTRLDDHADVAEAIVDLKVYQRQVQASAKVVQTADEVIGFLLDVV